MKQHLKIVFAAVLALAVAGCSGDIKRFWDSATAISKTTVPGSVVLASAQAFDGAELFGAAYLDLPLCTARSGPACRIRSATPIIKGAFQSGRIARDELKAQLRIACAVEYAADKECTAGIPIANYNTLIAATKTIEDATAAWRMATGK